jgi:outer membrane immunogenic protein
MSKAKFVFSAVAAVIAMTGLDAAHAADLPVRAYTKAPVIADPTYNWTGGYVGVSAGGAWGSSNSSTSTAFSPTGYFLPENVPLVNAAGVQAIKPNGFTGGLGAGYNWQADNFVFGLEGDIESFRLSGNASAAAAYSGKTCPNQCFFVMSSAGANWLATARGRIGVAASNWLFFATGGAAFTGLKGSFSFADNNPTTEAVSLSNSKTGYTLGGGIEAALWSRWSVKAEYLYVNFGSASATGALIQVPAQPMFHSIDFKASIARAGLNYRF